MPQFDEYPISDILVDDDILLFYQSATKAVRRAKAVTLKNYFYQTTAPQGYSNPLPGFVKWYRADSISLVGNEVVAFKDKTSAANDLTPLSSNPILVTDAINGKNAVRFQNRAMKSNAQSYASKTIYLVFKNNFNQYSDHNAYISYRNTNSTKVASSNEFLWIGGYQYTSNLYGFNYTQVYLDNILIDPNKYSYSNQGTLVSAYKFHLLEHIAPNSVEGSKTICFAADSFGSGRYLENCDIAECIIYPFVMTSEQRASMNNYFKANYNFSFL